MELIIISGLARVGKTTLANLLAKESFELGLVPKLLSFADPLKKEAEERGYSKEKDNEEYRKFCQEFGAMFRKVNPNHWVDLFEIELNIILKEEKLELYKNNPYWERCVIVDECRYQNEVGLGLKNNATMIFLSSGTRELSEANATWREHHSEELARAIEDGDEEKIQWYDCHLLNDGDVKGLSIKARAMAPIWCGIQANALTTNLEDLSNSGSLEGMDNMLNDLIDILLKEFEDGEEDDDPVPDDGCD